MDDDVRVALRTPADYSVAFTARVAGIRHQLSEMFGIQLSHDSDMNYSSGQRITACLTESGNPVGESSTICAFKITAHLSSRGPFFAISSLGKRIPGTREWYPISRNDLPGSCVSFVNELVTRIRALGMCELNADVLAERAEDIVTDLDGTPATVFDVLFTELL